jgi:PilZ domain
METDSGHNGGGRKCERRRFSRFATRLPVATRRDDLVTRGQSASRANCQLRLYDFSLGGLRGESTVALKASERLTMKLPPTATQPAIELTGRVIRCCRQDKRYHVGIELCQTDSNPMHSPFRQMPRLFAVAMDYAQEDKGLPQ